MVKVVDLFSGCGGLSLGFQNAGFDVVAGFENWDKAVSVYRANFEHPIIQMDLSNVDVAVTSIKQYNPDVIIGSPPCQDFSLAGKREEGSRANLTVSFAEIVAGVCPKWFVMENVANVRKSPRYEALKSILKVAGYGLTERVIDASCCGVPQKRKRLFLVGMLGVEDGFMFDLLGAYPFDEPMTVREYFKEVGIPLDFDHYYQTPSYGGRGVFSVDTPSGTLLTYCHLIPASYKMRRGDTADVAGGGVRPLTTLERSYIQTFPADFIWTERKTHTDKMIGNAVPPKLAEFVARALMHHIDTQKSVTPPMVSGSYNIILADPPWQYSFGKTSRGSIEAHYGTMTLEDIKALQIPADVDSVLYLWATAPYLPAALEVMQAWGFTYKSQMVWDKAVLGIGYWARGQHELLLIGTKGKVSPPAPEHRVSSVYREKRTEHSRKPDYFNALLEKQHPGGRFLELFARCRYSERWAVWGNEVECVDTENGGVL